MRNFRNKRAISTLLKIRRLTALGFTAASLAISSVSAHISPSDTGNIYGNNAPFGAITPSKNESPAEFVGRVRLKNLEFADLCDAYFIRNKDMVLAKQKLKLDVKSNPIILELTRRYPDESEIGYTWFQGPPNVKNLHPALEIPKNLSQSEQTMLGMICRNAADKLLAAYKEYDEALKTLATALKTSSHDQVETTASKANWKRSKLVELTGEEAVIAMDQRRGTDILQKLDKNRSDQEEVKIRDAVERFKKDEPNLSALCDAYLEHSAEIRFAMANISKYSMEKYTNQNPLILSLCKLPPFDSPDSPIAAAKTTILALTDPNLEPTYPAIEKRPPNYLLPAKARDSAWGQTLKDVETLATAETPEQSKKARLSNSYNVSLIRIFRNYADKLKHFYTDYLAALSLFSSSSLDAKPDAAMLKRQAEQLLDCRTALVGLCGENSVNKFDENNNAIQLIKTATNCKN